MAKAFTIELRGLKKFKTNLKRLKREVRTAAAKALNQEHEAIMTEAKKRTPVKSGALRDSGHVTPPEFRGSTVVSVGGFGGAAVQYAAKVHEDLTARHVTGRSKFYESALTEGVSGLAARLAKSIKSDLSRFR